MAKKPRLDGSLLVEFWEVDRHDLCVAGFTYGGNRVYLVSGTKSEVRDSLKEYKEKILK